ncbi:hypothetical protein KIN20_031634 [Parelaphostrongylus tenuis]|uniref:Uncharacterized protein n=1 Tax=Parelaphostrongylus tenuis TaxID=148309 RepID=A0AAD5R5K5_PARTN|nr:hypothetical protein KIN20_031634 [Parelaphostrongylus tenuis]
MGGMPTSHRVDGVFLFFMICLACSKMGVPKFSKIRDYRRSQSHVGAINGSYIANRHYELSWLQRAVQVNLKVGIPWTTNQ